MNIDYFCKYVEMYIHHRTGKEVVISRTGIDLGKLILAYNHAVMWIKEHQI